MPFVVSVRQCKSGNWSVVADNDRRGGLFRDRSSAISYAKREFGDDSVFTFHKVSDEAAGPIRLSAITRRRHS